jgi:anti-sigma regulatory factor (Ser/Thr protein kinase)
MPPPGGRDDRQRTAPLGEIEPGRIRIAGNETTAREINEAIEEGRVTAAASIGFLCECGSLGCGTIVELTLPEYEDVRRDPRQFVVAPAHEDPADAVVLAVAGRYTIVAKQGDAATLAEQSDPRTEGPVVQLIWSRRPSVSLISMDVDAVPEHVGAIRAWLVGFAAEHGADEDLQSRVKTAVTEAVSNVVEHAYRPGEHGRVHVSADVEDDDLEVVVADVGLGFHAGAPGGLGAGLRLLALTSDRFAIRERRPVGTEVWMRFALSQSPASPP